MNCGDFSCLSEGAVSALIVCLEEKDRGGAFTYVRTDDVCLVLRFLCCFCNVLHVFCVHFYYLFEMFYILQVTYYYAGKKF